MKTLITGVTGFTGRYLAQALLEAGHEVVGLAHAEGLVPGIGEIRTGDLRDSAWLREVVGDTRPKAVVHLAAIAFVAHGDVDGIYQTNLIGTRHLLEALATSGVSCERVLLASSANIYGNASEGMLNEDMPPAPANDYAVSKLAMEYVARLYASRLPIVVARPFNYTGVGQSESFLLPKIISHFRRRAPVIELGNLDVARDFSDVRTVVDCYQRLLASPAAIGGTFNVCSGRAVSLSAVLEMARHLSGHDMEVQVNPDFVRQSDVRILVGSRARLVATIGDASDIPLERTIAWMLEYQPDV